MPVTGNPDPLSPADLLALAWSWLSAHPWYPAVLVMATVLAGAGHALLHRHRHHRLLRGARMLTITVPPEVDAAGAAQFWATVSGALPRPRWYAILRTRAHLGFEYRWTGRQMGIVVWVPGGVDTRTVAAIARAAWPACAVEELVSGDPLAGGGVQAGGALLPVRAEAYPLRTDHDSDPLRQIIAACTGLRDDEHACVQILARPASARRIRRLRRSPAQLRDPHAHRGLDPGAPLRWLLDLITPAPTPARPAAARSDPARERDIRAVLDKAVAGPHWQVAIRYGVAAGHRRASRRSTPQTTTPRPPSTHTAAPHTAALHQRLRSRAAGIAGAFAIYAGTNRLRPVPMRHPGTALTRRTLRDGWLLSTAELAALAGLPADLAIPGLPRAPAKAVAAPVAVRTGGRHTIPLGRAQVGGHRVALSVADARQHVHVMGPTGVGKSTLLLTMALDHIKAGRGVVIIDPRGDLVTDILDRLPLEAAERLVLLDPAQEPPPAFNPLQGEDADLVVDNIVSIFGKIYQRHWGPRIDDILRSALLTLMAKKNPMLTMVPPLLNDRRQRAELTAELNDPAGLGGFWTWYDNLPETIRAQAVGPVLARLRAMLTRRFVRRVVGQPRSSFDMGAVLDGGILLCRLPKGVLGPDTTRLLGSFVVASVWQAATARASQDEDSRRDAVLMIDECHNFLNLAHSVDEICAEARGYHLSLVLAHQNLAQLGRETESAVSANCRNKIWFNCSADDARTLARHVRPELDEHDLSHLNLYTAAMRLVVGGGVTAPFTALTDPPPPPIGNAEKIRAECARLTAEKLPRRPRQPNERSTADQPAANQPAPGRAAAGPPVPAAPNPAAPTPAVPGNQARQRPRQQGRQQGRPRAAGPAAGPAGDVSPARST